MVLVKPIDSPQDHLAEVLADEIELVNKLIQEKMHSDHAPRIPEITAHLIGAGGKRLRPLLTLSTAKLFGYSGSKNICLAAAIEFIHTATLLHDDVVDESTQRRGNPTANLLWDNKSSILVGDYLFSRAFQLMVETNSMKVLDILSNASATIAEGEVLQLTTAHDITTDEKTYIKVIRGKTAALFSVATEVGGVIAKANEKQIKALFDYGDALGIAFQIVDDLLDLIGDPNLTGKNIGDDFRERKLTLPFIKAIKKASGKELEFWQRVIGKGDQEEDDLKIATSLLKSHGAIEETIKDALFWAQKAKNSTKPLPNNEIKKILEEFTKYVVERIT